MLKLQHQKGPCEILFDGKDIWVACFSSNSVIRVDIKENKIKDVVTNDLANPSGLIYDGRYIWTGNFDLYEGRTVAKIDPCKAQVVELVPTGLVKPSEPGYSASTPAAPIAFGFDGANVWVVNDIDASVTII